MPAGQRASPPAGRGVTAEVRRHSQLSSSAAAAQGGHWPSECTTQGDLMAFTETRWERWPPGGDRGRVGGAMQGESPGSTT